MKKSYSLREKSGERERFRIESFYHDYVEGDVYQSIRSLELWQRSYPRDRMSSLNNGFQHMKLGLWDRALAHSEHAAETEDSVIITSNLAIILLALERHADARTLIDRTLTTGFDAFFMHQVAYHEAFLRQDAIAMRRHAIAVAGRPGEEDLLLMTEANTEAYHGRAEGFARVVAARGGVGEARRCAGHRRDMASARGATRSGARQRHRGARGGRSDTRTFQWPRRAPLRRPRVRAHR